MIVACLISGSTVQTTALFETMDAAVEIASAIGADRVEEVTTMEPRPMPGWTWVEGQLPEPIEIIPIIRYISSRCFIDRFTDIEWEAICSHASAAAQAFVRWVTACGTVYLDDPRLIVRLQKAVTAGILTTERASEILS